MKKLLSVIFLVLLHISFISISYAAELKVGDKVSDFKLKDAFDKEYNLNSPEFAGKVVYIVYASTSSANDNDHITEACYATEIIPRLIRENKYIGLGIGNQYDSLVPNFIFKQVVKYKQKRTKFIVLLDPDFTIGNHWGLPHKIASSIILDKDRVVRYLYKGKIPAENIPQILEVIKKYTGSD
jgi:predicted transcriptional regulator